LNVLESWMSELERGGYKSRADIVNLFCRYIIPFLQRTIDLRIIVTQWRKDYEKLTCEFNWLQEIVFQNSRDTFKQILEEVGEVSEPISFKIKEIEEIIIGDRSRRGFSTWPLYWELYSEVKKLIDMLLRQGRHDLCSRYAIIGINKRRESYIIEFTFAPIKKVRSCEKMLDYNRYQDPIVVWKYFEKAHLFWNIKDEDIERELISLYKSNPFHAMSTRGTWEEIAMVKKHDESCEEPLIFKIDFFKKGLKTLINEIKTFSQTQE
jgi:hypothetical protein